MTYRPRHTINFDIPIATQPASKGVETLADIADSNTNVPSSPYRGEEVDAELAQKAATYFASQAYGGVRLFDVSTFFNLIGTKEAYSILLYRGKDPMPTPEEIDDKVNEHIKNRKKLEDQLQTSKGKAKAKIKAAISKAWSNISCPQDFVTVICGAHTGHVPVISMTEGLPIDMVLRKEIEEQLATQYGNQGVIFIGPIYFGAFDIGFEFEVDGRSVIVDPATYRETDKELLLYDYSAAAVETKKEKTESDIAEAIEERRALMQKKWDFVRSLGNED